MKGVDGNQLQSVRPLQILMAKLASFESTTAQHAIMSVSTGIRGVVLPTVGPKVG